MLKGSNNIRLNESAIRVLKERYLLRDENRKIIETIYSISNIFPLSVIFNSFLVIYFKL